MRRSGPIPGGVPLALVVLLAGCAAPPSRVEPPGRTVLLENLLDELDVAETSSSTGGVLFGRDEARPRLAFGWSLDQEDSAGSNVWAVGDESWLELPLVERDDVLAEVRAAALAFPDAPPQDVEVLLNGRSVGTFRATAAVEDHRLLLPREALWLGRNRLGFRFSWARRPDDVLEGNADRRELSVRFYRLGLRGVDATSAAPSRVPDGLELPEGTAATWFVPFPASGDELWLRIGARSGPLAVEVRGNGRRDPLAERLLEAGSEATWLGPFRRPAGGDRALLRIALGAPEGSSAVDAVEVHRLAATTGADPDPAPRTTAAGDAEPPAKGRPDVLLYVVDTLRADHLSAYGYGRPTSPRLEELAADGILFAQARAQSSWTRSAMVSVLTGRTPPAHGVVRRADALGPDVPVLAEVLGRAGWTTAAWITNGNLSQNFALDRGFDHFRYLNESPDLPTFHRLAGEIHDEAIPWLADAESEASRAPWFLWLHATDPHAPYVPPEPWRSRFAPGIDPDLGRLDRVQDVSRGLVEAPEGTAEAWRALYDAEIAATDAEFGRLLDALREAGTYDDTLIVFTSDHGEEFGDHGGWEHGKTLFDEQLRVPLVVKLPGNARAGTVRTDLVRQIDILPTILDRVGVEVPDGVEGRTLLRGGAEEPSYAHLEIDRRQLEGVLADRLKLVADRAPLEGARGHELFDLEADPGEQRNLWAERPIVAGWLEQEMRRLRLAARRLGPASTTEADIAPELRERLEALGYLK